MTHYLLAILLSALLYRWPRGTGLGLPDGHWLSRAPKSAELPWALGSALLFWWATGTPWSMAVAPLLLMGEAPGWSDWWPNNETVEPRYWTRMLKLSLRGCLLLNPLMGPIDFAVDALPTPGDKRIVGELLSGAVTAAAYLALLTYLT